MKLSDKKIESLAQKLVAWMQKSGDVEFLKPQEEARSAIIEEFQDEKELERQVDEEVEKLMTANEAVMAAENVDTWVMRKKVRQQIARKRGVVL